MYAPVNMDVSIPFFARLRANPEVTREMPSPSTPMSASARDPEPTIEYCALPILIQDSSTIDG
jgi:hypothetical protein